MLIAIIHLLSIPDKIEYNWCFKCYSKQKIEIGGCVSIALEKNKSSQGKLKDLVLKLLKIFLKINPTLTH